jgi:cysteine desulfurase
VDQIYLDNNATTRIDPRVAQAMADCYSAGYVNPASPHHAGRRTRRVLEQAREDIGRILGCHLSDVHADRIILTSGGTEANNLAILGLAGQQLGRVVISAIEHPSIVGPADALRQRGFELSRVRVTSDGVTDMDHLKHLLTADTRLVSIMFGNNETGVIQPVCEIAGLCARHNVPLHTDAVQAVGKIDVNFRQLGATALTLAAHKFHGPRGIGALLVRQEAKLEPILFGGFQQTGLRPGTEPVALAVGMHKALDLWHAEADSRREQMVRLREHFEAKLKAEHPEMVINGISAPRLPNTSSLSFPGLDRQALLLAMDTHGIACSTGSACASGSSEPSSVLLAMLLPEEVVQSSLRFSLGADTTREEIDESYRRISLIIKDLQRKYRFG